LDSQRQINGMVVVEKKEVEDEEENDSKYEDKKAVMKLEQITKRRTNPIEGVRYKSTWALTISVAQLPAKFAVYHTFSSTTAICPASIAAQIGQQML
jgi:hypothetical protein